MELAIVRLDKQGATAVKYFFLQAQTVDAIVRPHTSRSISIQSHTISIQSNLCCFVATGKVVVKKLRMGERAPTFFPSSSTTPSTNQSGKSGRV